MPTSLAPIALLNKEEEPIPIMAEMPLVIMVSGKAKETAAKASAPHIAQ